MDTAAELGEVKLAKGWTATMLEMPKRTVTQADGKKVSEAAASCAPPLAHRSAQLALFTQCPPLHLRRSTTTRRTRPSGSRSRLARVRSRGGGRGSVSGRVLSLP